MVTTLRTVLGDIGANPFVLMVEYEGRLPLLHVDFYRIEGDELPNLGLEEQIVDWPGVTIVEWAERFPNVLLEEHLIVNIEIHPGGRRVEMIPRGSRANQLCENMKLHHS